MNKNDIRDDMTVDNVYIVDINNWLETIEDIFNKYLPLEEESSFIFVHNHRFPIVNKADYKIDLSRPDMFSNIPFYPYKCISTVCDIIKHRLYNASSYYTEFKGNRVSKAGRELIDNDVTVEDIVINILPLISRVELSNLLSIIDNLIKDNKHIFRLVENHVIEFEYEDQYLKINDYGHILSYRYKELIDV